MRANTSSSPGGTGRGLRLRSFHRSPDLPDIEPKAFQERFPRQQRRFFQDFYRCARSIHLNRLAVDLDDVQLAVDSDPATLLSIHHARDKLALNHPERAELVKLRFFVGLSLPEAAAALGLSLTTAKRYWAFARAWLRAELGAD